MRSGGSTLTNTAVGVSALSFNNSGYGNAALGYGSLHSNISGYNNSAFGTSALVANTVGRENSAFGYQALASNSAGYQNTAVGSSALWQSVSGLLNVAVGSNAMFGNYNGIYNVAVGANALVLNNFGSNNTALGYGAGYSATGDGNIFLGYNAGYSETGSSKLYIANSNTSSPLIWGDFSSSILTVNGNLGIGTTTPGSKLTVAGNIFPSADDTYDLGDNTHRFANLYLGGETLHIGVSTGDEYTIDYNNTSNKLGFNVNGSGDPEIVFDGGGNVGIGTTTTGAYALNVAGDVNASTSLCIGGDCRTGWGGVTGDWSENGADIYNNNAGNVGIGTSTPGALLAVAGAFTATSINGNTLTAGTGTLTLGSYTLTVPATGTAALGTGAAGYAAYWSGTNTLASEQYLAVGRGGTGAGTFSANYLLKGNGTSALQSSVIFDDGTNVGIGTTAPNNLLSVYQLIDFNNTDYNTKLGYQAGQNIVSGAQKNTFLGYQAGLSSSGGSTNAADNNTAIGYWSFYSNTTGAFNSSMGFQALYSNTEGGKNSVVGSNALYFNTTGSYNTAVGYNAGAFTVSGSNNTLLGYRAGYGVSTNSYSDNTIIGYQAGYSLATGSDNVFLGYNAGYNETGSNKLYIANSNTSSPLIWGDFSSSILTVNGNLGIGTTTPGSKLTISGGGLAVGTSYATTAAGDGNIIASGNVGIGTTSSGYSLQVEKDALGTTSTPAVALVNATAATAGATQQYSPSLYLRGNSWAGSVSQPVDWQMFSDSLPYGSAASGTFHLQSRANNGAWADKLSIRSYDGAVVFNSSMSASGGLTFGIGANDSYINISGPGVGFGNFLYNNYMFEKYTNFGKNHNLSANTNPTVYVYSAADLASDTTQWLSLTHDQTNGVISTGKGSLILSPATGNVGIGTTSPGANLEVNGTLKVDSLTTGGSALYINGGILSSSDRSLKKNIQDFGSVLDKINQLKPVTFDWKGDGSADTGFIAQDVQQVFPELVGDLGGGQLGVYYSKFTPYLTKAIQEQQGEIGNLTTQSAQLETQFGNLNLNITQNSTDVFGLQTAVNDKLTVISNSLTMLDSHTTASETDIKDIKTRLTDAETKLETDENNLLTYETSVNDLIQFHDGNRKHAHRKSAEPRRPHQSSRRQNGHSLHPGRGNSAGKCGDPG